MKEEDINLEHRLLASNTSIVSIYGTLQTASEQEVTDWIVFGLSIASFVIIMFYVGYETLYPLVNHEELQHRTWLEYTRRYNREEYERLKPKLIELA